MSTTPPLGSARCAAPHRHRPALDETQGAYRVRFASSAADLEAALRLRFAVFNLELGEGLAGSEATGLDRDEFDAQFDHLLVEHLPSGRVIGTYRTQVAEMAAAGAGFYSATEFELGHLPAGMLARSVELGRACIAREHRNTKVLSLLWRGLAAYAYWNQRRYLLGCSSLTSQDPREGLRAYDHLLRQGHQHPALCVAPRPDYACLVDGHEDDGSEVELPRLFGTYLRYGAKICGPPAIDRFFGTIDFLTLIDLGAMDPRMLAVFAAGLEGPRG